MSYEALQARLDKFEEAYNRFIEEKEQPKEEEDEEVSAEGDVGLSEGSENEQGNDAMLSEEEQIDGDQNNRDRSEDSDADEDYDPAKDPNCNGFFKKSAASKKSAKSLKRLAKNKVSFFMVFT